MTKSRLEAFSDGVLAIIITIMVLELPVPHADDVTALVPLLPIVLSYVLSFVFIGIYWNNHHHLFQVAMQIDGRVLWANLLLLFWLSLIPFATAWMGETSFATWPVAVYGTVLLLAGLTFWILTWTLRAIGSANASLATALGRDRKGVVSPLCCALAIALAFVSPWLAGALYVLVAVLWLIPDRRFERMVLRREN